MRASVIGYGLAIIIGCAVISSVAFWLYFADPDENTMDWVIVISIVSNGASLLGFAFLISGLILSPDPKIMKVEIIKPIRLNEEKMVQRKLLERELIEKVNVHTDKIKEQEKAIEYIMDRLAYVIQTQQPNIKKRLTKTPIHKCEAIVDEQRR